MPRHLLHTIPGRDNISAVTVWEEDDGSVTLEAGGRSIPSVPADGSGVALAGPVKVGPTLATVAALPVAAVGLAGYRAYVTDATVAYTGANIGSTVVGEGANVVPVFCDGVHWVIG